MTKREMEQCVSLRHEIKAIEESMKSPKSTYVSVFYKDYRSGKGVPKSIQGYDNGEEQLRLMAKAMEDRKAKLLRRLDQAEDFIKSVEDTETRTILRMLYINGEKQEDIARALGYERSTISKKLKAFWMSRIDKS